MHIYVHIYIYIYINLLKDVKTLISDLGDFRSIYSCYPSAKDTSASRPMLS